MHKEKQQHDERPDTRRRVGRQALAIRQAVAAVSHRWPGDGSDLIGVTGGAR